MDDKTVVQMYWDRDENAITLTSEKYGAYCLSIARNILSNHEDAEECVSDAYLNTWNSIPTNRPKVLSTYLGKIVRNLSFNLYKKNRAKKRGEGQIELVLEELSEVVADSKTVEDEWDEKQLLRYIDAFLENLKDKDRKIFVCRYWYSYDVKDIAKRFGMAENTVSVKLKRLRKGLHDFLCERGFKL